MKFCISGVRQQQRRPIRGHSYNVEMGKQMRISAHRRQVFCETVVACAVVQLALAFGTLHRRAVVGRVVAMCRGATFAKVVVDLTAIKS